MAIIIELSIPLSYASEQEQSLLCTVDNSDNAFLYYPEHLIFATPHYLIFQNDEGQVITHVDISTQIFVRVKHTTNPFKEKPQMLLGYCEKVREALSTWLLD
ncbi:hypothetical protein [Photobacterium lipolyticum]|nr:hypothetical protein [Photobacterium lipolyticum]